MIRNGSLTLALALAFFFAPLGGVPFADGLPLDSPWELIIIALLVSALALTVRHPVRHGRWALILILAILLTGAKVFVYQHQLPHGLAGRYRTEPPGVGAKWERALHQSIPDATRLDGPLAFYNTGYRPGKSPFPFFFFNDKHRHPWIGHDPTVRPTVHVQWDGYLVIEQPGLVNFRLETTDTCGLTLDGRVLIAPGEGLEHCGREASAELTEGFHPLQVTYVHDITDLNAPSPKSRLLLQWRQGEGLWEVVPLKALLPFRPTKEAFEQDRRMWSLAQLLFWGQWFLLVVGLGTMLSSVPLNAWRGERGLLACVALLLIAMALGMTLRDARDPASNYVWLGSDETLYEADAQAFIRESWVTTPSIGHGKKSGNEPKILYAYFLATAHLLLGEPLVQVVLLQRLLLVTAAFLIYWIGKTYFSPRVGFYAMMLTALATHMLGWSRALYPASLATVLLTLTLVCIFQGNRLNSKFWMVGAGATLGLLVHTRPNFMPCYIVVLLWLAISHRPWHRTLTLIGSFVLGAGLVEGLAIIRSLAAYGAPFAYQNMLPINIMRGNPIPPGVDLGNLLKAKSFGLSEVLQVMWAFAAQKPLAFATQWLHKFLYLFGINTMGSVWNPGLFTYEIFFFSVGGLLGAVLAIQRYGRRATWLPLAFVAVNGAVFVATSPDLHGFRLMVPLLPLLAIYVGVVLECLDLSRPIQASWKGNLLKSVSFFALLPFRYGFQYALMGAAYLWPTDREKRTPLAILEELLNKPKATSSLTQKVRPLK